MNFVLVYEINNREFLNMELLKRELIRRGHTVALMNKTESMKFFYKPGLMLVPNSYNKENLDNYRFVFNSRNNIVVNYPCEQLIHRTLPNFYDRSNDNPVKKIPTLCWGKEYHDFICEMGNDHEKCYITGAIQLDFCRKEFFSIYLSRNELSLKYEIPKNKKWILFISDFVYVNRKNINKFLKANVTASQILVNEHIFQVKSQKQILIWFDQLLSTSDEYVVVYRRHQNEVVSQEVDMMCNKHKESFFEIGELNIRNWIIMCDYIFNYNSTSGAECIVAGKDNAILRPYEFTDNIKFKEQEINKKQVKITNYEDLIKYVNKKNNDVVRKDYISSFYSITDVPSFKRVADCLEFIAQNEPRKKCEHGFFLARWFYILKKFIIPKIIIKYIYKKMFLLFHFKESKSRSIGEWQKTAVNYRNEKRIAEQLDSIINNNFVEG